MTNIMYGVRTAFLQNMYVRLIILYLNLIRTGEYMSTIISTEVWFAGLGS